MKKLMILFVLAGLLLFSLQAVSAAECGNIPSNGCSVSSSTVFNSGIYYFNGISSGIGAINIMSSNIVLDCNGSTFIGNLNFPGIYSSSKNNVTIKNCNIFNYSKNIQYASSSNNLAENITSCYGSIWIDSSSYNNIVNNSVLCNASSAGSSLLTAYSNSTLSNSIVYTDGSYGLVISRGGNKIYNNIFYSPTSALSQGMINFNDNLANADIFNNRFYNITNVLKFSSGGNNSRIYNNWFENIKGYSMFISGANTSIYGNYFLNNSQVATITSNKTLFYNNTIDYVYGGDAIVVNSANNSLYNNTFYNLSIGRTNKAGILISYLSSNNLIYSNNFESGFSMASFITINGENNDIYNNIFGKNSGSAVNRGVDVAYLLGKGSNNTIRDNIFYNLGTSVKIYNVSNINIINNKFYEQNWTAISFGEASKNINISGNIIQLKSSYPYCQGISVTGSNHYISGNNISVLEKPAVSSIVLISYFGNNSIISNNSLSGAEKCIYSYKGNSLFITGNKISCRDYGIHANSDSISSDFLISGNLIESNLNFAGIFLNNIDDYTISNNILSGNENGIWLYSDYKGSIHKNTFYNNRNSGLIVTSKNYGLTEVYDNNFGSNGYAVTLSGNGNFQNLDVKNIILHNNYMNNNYYASYLVKLSETISIRNEIIEYGGIGIYLKDAYQKEILLENNTIRHNLNDGIQIYGTYYSTITNNTIYNNSYVGITAAHGENNNYTNNNITGNGKMGIAISTRGAEGHASTIIRDNIVNNNGEVGIYANPSIVQPVIINNTVTGHDIGITGFYSDNIYYNNTITGNDYDALISRNFNISYYFAGDNVTIQSKNNPALTLTYPNGISIVLEAVTSGSNYNYTFTIPKNGIYSINGSYSDLNGNNYTKLKFIAGNYFVPHSVTFYHRGGTSNLADVSIGNFSLINNAFVLAHGWYSGNGHDHGTALLSAPAVEEEAWCNCGNGHSVDELVSEMKAPSIVSSTYTYSNTSFQYSLAKNFNVSIGIDFNGKTKNSSYMAGTMEEKSNSTSNYYVYEETLSYSDFNVSTHLDWYRIGEGINDINMVNGRPLCGVNSTGGADTRMAIKEKSSPNAPSYTVFNFSSLSYNVSYSGNNNIYFYDSDSRLVSNLSSTGSLGLTIDNNYTVVITGMSSGDYVSGLDDYSYSNGDIIGHLFLDEDKEISVGIQEENFIEINNCKIINESGNYILMNDILEGNSKACIDIRAENVHLDCNNHLISVSSSAGIISGKSGTIIENCRIDLGRTLLRSRKAIVLGKADNQEIRNNHIENNDYGIFAVNSFNLIIENNSFKNNTNGIEMRGSIGSSIIKNVFNYTSSTALLVQYGSDNIISENSIYRADFAGIYIYLSSGNKIMRNSVKNSGKGFYLRTGNNNEFSNNTACDNYREDVYCSLFAGYGNQNKINKVFPCTNFKIVYNSC